MRKGWFVIPGVQDGDRTLLEQVEGLEGFDFTGKFVLDLGCAEGLISRWVLERGARLVHGVEIIPEHVEEARRQCGDRATFWVRDMREGLPDLWKRYDVVLLLSILHKLKEPLTLLDAVAQLAPVLVIRLPHRVLADVRSAPLRQHIPDYLAARFDLVAEPKTCRDEWLGIFKACE